MIHIKNAQLTFKEQIIFDNITCTFKTGDRVGLVGLNGTGKSTLLRVISGQQQLDSGIVQKSSSLKIGYMPQEITLTSSKTVLNEALTAIDLHDEFELPRIQVKAQKILLGLGFNQVQLDKPVAQLSTGWKMRVLLAQLLLQNADFYLFDEPTNHLDLLAKEWFFDFLKNAQFGFLLVSHDRYFLDGICTSIIELENGACTKYNGNYTQYVTQKEERDAIIRATYENQQKTITRKQKTIDRFKAQASRARMVKKMEKELEKMDVITIQSKPSLVHFSFPPVQESGKVVLTVENIKFAFGEKFILNDASCLIQKNERVAIVAPNGTGKTTFLNLVMGKYKPQSGKIIFGHNVITAYFEQDQLETFDPEKTIFETVYGRTQANDQMIRTLLGGFLFSGDVIDKKIKVLSGGEKNRVNMSCTLLQKANFLLLDEPTNHLDIYSKEILLQALKEYHGTILFVSHDHNFVNNLSTSILELSDCKLAHYHGNYESYLEQKKMAAAGDQNSEEPHKKEEKETKNNKQDNKKEFERRNQLGRVESKIRKLEKQIQDLHKRFEKLVYGTKEFDQAQFELQKTQKELDDKMREWEELFS